RYSFESIEEVELALCEYFDYYNHRRPHQSFRYFTPADMYFQHRKKT
ncbi:integrase core domain-containing protein, partial [Legionella geestiana]